MGTLFETILPTGMAIRYRAVRTRDKLEIDRAVGRDGADVDVMKRTIMTCVIAYTKPLELKYRDETEAELADRIAAASARGFTLPPSALKAIKIVDVDATLEATPASAWITATPQGWVLDGPENFFEVFDNVADFQTAMSAIQRASGLGIKDGGLFAGKARALSSGP